jgi:hypothetical protein
MAVPMPWTARAPISTPMDGASAQAADDAVNKPSPATRTPGIRAHQPHSFSGITSGTALSPRVALA